MPKSNPKAQQLRYLMSLIDQGRADQGMSFGPEAVNPEFMYPGDPNRNPFEAPLPEMRRRARPASSPRGGKQLDARGIQIAPQILQAMELMRARKAMGFKSAGDQAQEEFQARGGYQRSPLWG